MTDRILVLAGTHAQFNNFAHAFGDRFVEITGDDTLESWRGDDRPLVLLVGTWVMNPLRERVMGWAQQLDRDSRPRGQTFVMLGRGK